MFLGNPTYVTSSYVLIYINNKKKSFAVFLVLNKHPCKKLKTKKYLDCITSYAGAFKIFSWSLRNRNDQDAWLAQSVEHVSLDLRVMKLSPVSGSIHDRHGAYLKFSLSLHLGPSSPPPSLSLKKRKSLSGCGQNNRLEM